MRKFLSVFCFLFITISIYSQQQVFKEGRYRITFNDKNNSPFSIEKPEDFLSEKALNRRVKFNIPITEQDLPVTPQYLSVVSDFGGMLCNSSKWFNSAIFYIESEVSFNEIAKLSFVKSLEYVAPAIVYHKDGRKLVEQESIKEDLSIIPENLNYNNFVRNEDFFEMIMKIYGGSAKQNYILSTIDSHCFGHLGQNVTIAVVDAGFLHVDSAAVFQKLWDEKRILLTRDVTGTKAFYDSSSIYQTGGHGMMVLSLIGGFYPGQLIGTAPAANFILIRSEEEETEYIVEEDNWVAAAELADSAGADIISTSLGYSNFDDTTQSHTYKQMDGHTTRITLGSNIAASKGMLLLNSAGNSGDEPWKYITAPADADSIITVGACNYKLKKTKFSSFGPTSDGRIKPDVTALGLLPMIVTANGQIKHTSGGTSFSCPLTAGSCATLWEEFPDSSAQTIKEVLLITSSMHKKPDNKYGHGIPSIERARNYFYAKQLYDTLTVHYNMPSFEKFFEQICKDKITLARNFIILMGNKNPSDFIIKEHDYSNLSFSSSESSATTISIHSWGMKKTSWKVTSK